MKDTTTINWQSVFIMRDVAEILRKLDHAKESEFSAHVTPDECQLLLAWIEHKTGWAVRH
jgi:hypothetical protein